jgi:hypothetical protein
MPDRDWYTQYHPNGYCDCADRYARENADSGPGAAELRRRADALPDSYTAARDRLFDTLARRAALFADRSTADRSDHHPAGRDSLDAYRSAREDGSPERSCPEAGRDRQLRA